jgi:hypothetical protein
VPSFVRILPMPGGEPPRSVHHPPAQAKKVAARLKSAKKSLYIRGDHRQYGDS